MNRLQKINRKLPISNSKVSLILQKTENEK